MHDLHTARFRLAVESVVRLELHAAMILSAWDFKVRGLLCALQFVCIVDLSMSHGGRDECGMPTGTAPGLPLSVTLVLVFAAL